MKNQTEVENNLRRRKRRRRRKMNLNPMEVVNLMEPGPSFFFPLLAAVLGETECERKKVE